jgi:hypothetical protein
MVTTAAADHRLATLVRWLHTFVLLLRMMMIAMRERKRRRENGNWTSRGGQWESTATSAA